MRKLLFSFCLLLTLTNCQDNDAIKQAEISKETQKQEQIFQIIQKNWNFTIPSFDSEATQVLSNWPEWNNFITEISQKPKTDIGAFRQKSKVLSIKIQEINNTLPEKFENNAIKSRLKVLESSILLLETLIQLDHISTERTVESIKKTNTNLIAVCNQMNEIFRWNKIPLEDGEIEMLNKIDNSK